MFFQMRFLYHCNLYHLLGSVSRNGKLYFSALDVGLALNQANVYGWAETVASCQWKDIIPDCDSLLGTRWVIEHHALMQLLMCRRFTLQSSQVEQNLLGMLQQRHFRIVQNFSEKIIQLEECTVHEGKCFLAWKKDFRNTVLQTPQWLLDLGLEP